MSQPGHPPRDYQIDELTRGGKSLPAALEPLHVKVIAEFLVRAWEGLLETQQQVIRTQDEPEINTLIETRLNQLLDAPGEYSALIWVVVRGKESINHDASSLENRPDLSVYLTKQDRRRFPLSVECKLIDKKAKKEVALYGSKGLARFLNGDYAPKDSEAFMVAYVRDGSSIAGCLTPHLARRQKKVPDPFLTMQLPQAVKLPSQDLAKSRHGRRFQNRFQNNPGPIDIWHLWLSPAV